MDDMDDTEGALPDAVMERFNAWAGALLRDEAAPQGLVDELLDVPGDDAISHWDQAGIVDAYGLWCAVTALTQEVKLQGRAFKQLSENLSGLEDIKPSLDRVTGAHAEALEEARRLAREAYRQRGETDRAAEVRVQRQAQRGLLLVLTDLRDRLRRSIEAARTSRETVAARLRPGWFGRLRGRAEAFQAGLEAMEALEKGNALCLERIEDMLARLGVRETLCLGQPFDPQTMVAVDIVESAGAPEGAVVEVYKPGYVWDGELLQTAQVKAVRAPRPIAVSPKTKEEEHGE